jgi:hypothetical protein
MIEKGVFLPINSIKILMKGGNLKMEYKNVGRPIQEKTLVRNGKSIMFWLDAKDYLKLLELEKESRVSRSELFRILIRKAK